MMSIREKRGYICVEEYNPFIDVQTYKTYPRGIKILKPYVMYMMCLNVFNFFICISEMDEKCEKNHLKERTSYGLCFRKM